jgi:hypothetical protein
MAALYIFGHLVFFPRFGMLHQEKSGNPGLEASLIAQQGGRESIGGTYIVISTCTNLCLRSYGREIESRQGFCF